MADEGGVFSPEERRELAGGLRMVWSVHTLIAQFLRNELDKRFPGLGKSTRDQALLCIGIVVGLHQKDGPHTLVAVLNSELYKVLKIVL